VQKFSDYTRYCGKGIILTTIDCGRNFICTRTSSTVRRGLRGQISVLWDDIFVRDSLASDREVIKLLTSLAAVCILNRHIFVSTVGNFRTMSLQENELYLDFLSGWPALSFESHIAKK
jgi:hypothetical protein